MKSSMTFIRGNGCIERKKDIFKIGGEVKRLKEFALALICVLYLRNIHGHDDDSLLYFD